MSAGPETTPANLAPPRGRRATLVALGRHLLPAMIAAGIAGFLVGGIGGRLAMYVLRLTSGPEVIGLASDDDFVIGRFSFDTLNLVIAVTVGAAIVGGPAYALLRLWLPVRWRPAVLALFFGLVDGAMLVHTDGVDFTVLSPRALSVALFVAIPAAFGAVLDPLHAIGERWTRRAPEVALLGVVLLGSGWPILLGAGVIGLAIGAFAWGAVLLGPMERIGQALQSRPVAWAARIAMAALALLAVNDLARDVQTLLALG